MSLVLLFSSLSRHPGRSMPKWQETPPSTSPESEYHGISWNIYSLLPSITAPRRFFSAPQEVKSAGNFKVCVCGGAGGIGQPLSMLMALDPNVKESAVILLGFDGNFL